DRSMNVNRQVQTAALLHEIAEYKILKSSVLFSRWNSANHVARVNVFCLGSGRIGERGGPEIRDLELDRNAPAPGIVLQRLADELHILRKIRWQLANIFLLHPAVQ